jgi:hypothetical protein
MWDDMPQPRLGDVGGGQTGYAGGALTVVAVIDSATTRD